MREMDCMVNGKVQHYTLFPPLPGKVWKLEKLPLQIVQYLKTYFKRNRGFYMDIVRNTTQETKGEDLFCVYKDFTSFTRVVKLISSRQKLTVEEYLEPKKNALADYSIQQILINYYLVIFDAFSRKELGEFFFVLHNPENGYSKEDALMLLQEEFVDPKIRELAAGIFYECLVDKFMKRYPHLCGSDICDIETMARCMKVFDSKKKNIDQYSFIRNGVQLWEDEELQDFLVYHCTSCTKYSKMDVPGVDGKEFSTELEQKIKSLQVKNEKKLTKKV